MAVFLPETMRSAVLLSHSIVLSVNDKFLVRVILPFGLFTSGQNLNFFRRIPHTFEGCGKVLFPVVSAILFMEEGELSGSSTSWNSRQPHPTPKHHEFGEPSPRHPTYPWPQCIMRWRSRLL